MRRRYRVCLDATPSLYTAYGIGRTTSALIRSLQQVHGDLDLSYFGRRLLGRRLREVLPGQMTHHLRLPRKAESMIAACGLVELMCGADLYHATDFYLPVKDPRRVVATIHDVIFLSAPEEMVDHSRLRRWVPSFAARCRRIIADSEYSRCQVLQYLPVKEESVDVVYLGADRSMFRPPANRHTLTATVARRLGFDAPFFFAASCSTGRKNTPRLLRAYARLAQQEPHNHLVLAWEAPPEVRSQYSTGKLAQRIHFLGRQSDEALRDLYGAATAFLYPSLCEGFGLPVLEAMSCGTPVITSNTSSLPEVGGDAAIYVDPTSETSIMEAMEAFENRRVCREEVARRGLRHSASFSWERCARETLAVYHKCLES